jgi:hypothetical protein
MLFGIFDIGRFLTRNNRYQSVTNGPDWHRPARVVFMTFLIRIFKMSCLFGAYKILIKNVMKQPGPVGAGPVRSGSVCVGRCCTGLMPLPVPGLPTDRKKRCILYSAKKFLGTFLDLQMRK